MENQGLSVAEKLKKFWVVHSTSCYSPNVRITWSLNQGYEYGILRPLEFVFVLHSLRNQTIHEVGLMWVRTKNKIAHLERT